MARPLGGYFRLVYLSFLCIVSILVVIRSLRSLGRSTPPLYRLIIKAPWDRGSPSSAPPAPHRMLHEQRFVFLASKAIVFALSCVYGLSLYTVYLTNVINPTPPPTTLRATRRYKSSRRAGKNWPKWPPGVSQGKPPEGTACVFMPSSSYNLLLIPEFCPGGQGQRLAVNKSILLVLKDSKRT